MKKKGVRRKEVLETSIRRKNCLDRKCIVEFQVRKIN